ncbi:ABC transporter permease [Streptomyces sp. NPDC057137]|uniref:ABC transporter permease n=1 Tax=Streptomyces sp. NPDC057137 TaxID=3346030 RepID=UPI0036297FCD
MSTLTPRGPAWVAIRQNRPALWTALLITVLAVGCWIAARVWVGSTGFVVSCGKGCDASTNAAGWFRWAENYVAGTAILLPLLVAAFTAGPLIARELASGTYRLAWTQSVSPARWLAVRLACAAAVATAGTVLLVVTFRWSRSYTLSEPYASMFTSLSWDDREAFPAMGLTAVGYVLLAVAVGALAAVLVRRTLPAMAVGLVATGGVGLLFAWVRPYLWPTLTAERKGMGAVADSSHPWIVQRGVVLADGSRMTQEECWDMGYAKSPCGSESPDLVNFADYHPTSHLWPLQLVETGIVLLLAAACVFAAFKVLRRIHG